ncbi:hypothetical protein Hypma_005476 [Hypsizygus marmoreus]|uniref:Ribonuclease H1 N-terminal domain-containing protein n=1 Tax=Hypsizygus marmoreus TaxID=39966 RepID=A0A369IZ54_HYPMA|nr:hypothetical protein Hypma_005476 [Hypsizygus marmoreus]
MHLTADHLVTGPSFTSPAKPSPAKPSPARSLGKAQCTQGPSPPVKNETDDEEDDVLPDLGHLSINDAFAHANEESLRGEPDPSQPTQKRAREKEGYIVLYGRRTGVFRSWPAASAQISGFSGARFKGYYVLEDAVKAWHHACANNLIGPPASAPLTPPPSPSPSRTQHRGPSLTELSAKKSMSSEECFWSVVRGDHPGVYKGETAARAAIGSHPRPAVYKNTAGQASASILFTRKYMEGEVDHH